MLAIVTPIRLLREFLTTGLDDRAWRQTAWLEAHQDTMRTTETEDVCFAHGASFEVSCVWDFASLCVQWGARTSDRRSQKGSLCLKWDGGVVLVVRHMKYFEQSLAEQTSSREK